MPAALIIESDVVLRNVVRSALMLRGFEVLDAANATEALTLLEAWRDPAPDLLIVAEAQPSSGERPVSTAVTEHILSFAPQIRILVISESTYPIVLERKALPDGCWFLQKPFTAAQFVEMIHNIFEAPIQ